MRGTVRPSEALPMIPPTPAQSFAESFASFESFAFLLESKQLGPSRCIAWRLTAQMTSPSAKPQKLHPVGPEGWPRAAVRPPAVFSKMLPFAQHGPPSALRCPVGHTSPPYPSWFSRACRGRPASRFEPYTPVSARCSARPPAVGRQIAPLAAVSAVATSLVLPHATTSHHRRLLAQSSLKCAIQVLYEPWELRPRRSERASDAGCTAPLRD
mmetsp:Transcript_73550/g.116908  ORF Transcript_73550/g.116908 Transcript_73550/m.116908 type:complete len:212 (+) Transcript_73550:518-1153(+)